MKNDPNNLYSHNADNDRANVTRGELFVGANLIGKIGAVFIIAGVIAFSAASNGYIRDGVRMAMVFAAGIIMLAVGELFFRKGSKTFSSALVFGGVAELFIGGLAGYHGLKVLNDYTIIIAAVCAAIIGIFLSLRYKSQALLAVTLIFSALPVFIDGFFGSRSAVIPFLTVAVYYTAVHCACAVISRRYNYTAANFIGLSAAVIETVFILVALLFGTRFDNRSAMIFSTVFIGCAAVIYSSAPLLNAFEDGGQMSASDKAQFITIQSFAFGFAQIFLFFGAGERVTGIVFAVLAVFSILLAVFAALRFDFNCGLCSVLTNIALAALTIGIIDLFNVNVFRYIAVHVFGAALLITGTVTKRNILKNWGFALLVFAELLFMALSPVMSRNVDEKICLFIVNITVWLAVMILFIMLGKHKTTSFRAYSTAVLANIGILLQNIIITVIAESSNFGGDLPKRAYILMLSAMLWFTLGFLTGKIKYMKRWGTVSSFCFYGLGLLQLFLANVQNQLAYSVTVLKVPSIAVTVVVNAVSILFVLDLVLKINSMAPKFSIASGLIISAYSLITLIVTLGTNNFVQFTSFIISIICIAAAIAWIVFGFIKRSALLRRFGLALVLLASAKLFLFDFRGINPVGRTLLFIGFGITLLAISFVYGIAKNHHSK